MPTIPLTTYDQLEVEPIDEVWAKAIVLECIKQGAHRSRNSGPLVQNWFQQTIGDNDAWRAGITYAARKEWLSIEPPYLRVLPAGFDLKK